MRPAERRTAAARRILCTCLSAWRAREPRVVWPQGEVIERGLIKSVTQMLMDLGPAVYVADFETPYLASAAEHYKARRGTLAFLALRTSICCLNRCSNRTVAAVEHYKAGGARR